MESTNKNIAAEYNFSDFTTEHYRELIKQCKENYRFSRYYDFDKQSKFVLWRHDIDFSVHRAYRLAQIEQEESVCSTWFIHLHNEFYNVFEKEIFELIKKLISLGHDIGVHFDSHFYGIKTETEIEKYLTKEKKILEDLFETKIHSFSFHNTDPFVMSCQKWEYAGLINTYAAYFQKEVTYCSDSNGYWRYNRMKDLIESGTAGRLHLLTHPEWWQEEAMSPWEKIQHCAEGRATKNLENYQKHLRNYKMQNIGPEGPVL